jgi:hypothetical protein
VEFLNRLMGGSFSVEAAETKAKGCKKFVAFQGFITIRATFHPDIES